ncbi:hypothetical protein H8356DRAFT_1340973 [Neocallimastix lanati (nom. inval.)]|nr:hypothetical protein H8356DRAFT_1340973 [Neocallimastix sp. JGI-2020a]
MIFERSLNIMNTQFLMKHKTINAFICLEEDLNKSFVLHTVGLDVAVVNCISNNNNNNSNNNNCENNDNIHNDNYDDIKDTTNIK